MSTFPLLFQPDTHMLSGKYQWSHAWAMEMVHQGLEGRPGLEIERQPFSWKPADVIEGAGSFQVNTQMLDYPRGGKLVLLSWPNILLGHLLRTLGLKPLLAFNISFLLSLSLAPFFAYFLARSSSISKMGSAVTAILFSCSPYIMGVLYNGQLAKANHWCLAALALASLNVGRGKLLYVPLLAVMLPICFSTSPYYLLFAIIPCTLLFCYGWWEQRNSNLLHKISGVLITLSIAFYTCFPLFFHYKGRIRSLLAPATGGQSSDDLGIISTVSSWFIPTALSQANGDHIQGELHFSMLGIGVLLLAGFGLFKHRHPLQILWGLLIVVFAFLSLGSAAQQGWSITLPFDYIQLILPANVDVIMRYRSIIVGTLGVAILAGFSVDILQRHKGQLWALGLPFLCLFEYTLSSLPFPSPTEPVHLPRVYVDLSADSKPYGIVEFPCDMLSPHDLHPEYFALLNKLNQQQLFYQIFHGKGLGMVDKANLSREVYQTPLLRKIQQLAFQKTVPIIGEEQNDSLEWFENRGFHYIIIHDAYIPPTNRASIHIYLQQELGDGEHYPSDQVWLYSFPNQESQ